MTSSINESKLMGGKRKNGHKSNCICHICENMKNKARRGGYEEEVEKQKENMMGGSKKKNGHRKACMCPICKNMKNSKKRGGSKSNRRTRRRKGGDDKEDTDSDTSDEEEEMGEENEDDKENTYESMNGGKRKRGNGHKKNCKCPICKNMRKSKRGGEEPDEENQMGDIEEAGIRSSSNTLTEQPMPTPETPEIPETPASNDEYDELLAAEEGRAGPNSNVGGTRKRRRGGKKWGGKKRKTHRRH